jgi:hypothetical protein
VNIFRLPRRWEVLYSSPIMLKIASSFLVVYMYIYICMSVFSQLEPHQVAGFSGCVTCV